ncbi:MAG TPA: hypothetical protein VGM86_33235 [Thermoanaerobaculia bacterium]|jgi:hypothetical protein
MKRFVIREVETLKTTAAMYGCDCCCPDMCPMAQTSDGIIVYGCC